MTKTQIKNWREPRNGAADLFGCVIPLVNLLLGIGAICAWLASPLCTIPLAGSIAWLIGLLALGVIWAANVERSWWTTTVVKAVILLIFYQRKTVKTLQSTIVRKAFWQRFLLERDVIVVETPLQCRPAVQPNAPSAEHIREPKESVYITTVSIISAFVYCGANIYDKRYPQ